MIAKEPGELFNVRIARKDENIFVVPALPRVINFQFPLQLHQRYYITQYEELDFFIAYSDEGWLTLPILTTVLFELGSRWKG